VLHLMLATLAFAAQLLSLAPQYATFGPQAYVDTQATTSRTHRTARSAAHARTARTHRTHAPHAHRTRAEGLCCGLCAQGAVRPCSLECATSHSDGPDASPCAAKCQLSGLATTLLTLSLRLPFFGAAWRAHSEYIALVRYYAQWLYLAWLHT
jgi:hypothetical protein